VTIFVQRSQRIGLVIAAAGFLSLLGGSRVMAQTELSQDAVRSALVERPDDVNLLCRLGDFYLKAGEADSAEQVFDKALKADRQSFDAKLGLGRIFLELKFRPKKSLGRFREAVEIDSTRAVGYGYLAGAYLETGDEDRAEEAAQHALTLDPKYAPAYLVLARVAQKAKNETAAMSFYQKYIDSNPEDPSPVLAFAEDFLEKKQFDKVTEIASLIKHEVALPLLAQVRMHLQDHEGAFALFDAYVKSLPIEEQAVYEDISSVGTAQDIAAYKTVLPENRPAFLRSFWLRKDPFKTSGGTMRQVEHYRRVWHARLYYGKKNRPWDKRGDVYVRYGEPDYQSNWRDMNAKVPLKVQRVQEQIAFQLYGRQGLDVTYVGPVDMNRPLDDPGFAGVGLLGWKPVTVGNEWAAVPWEVWIYTEIDKGLEVAFTDEFHSGIFNYAPVPTLSLDEIRSISITDRGSPLTFSQRLTSFSPAARVATVASKEPDRYDISELEPFNFYYDPIAFRGQDGKTELQIDFGLPIDEVSLPDDDPSVPVLVERRFALIDAANQEVARDLKDVSLPITRAIRGKGLLARDRARLAIQPGPYELAVQMRRVDSKLLGVYQQSIEAHDFRGDALMLSDLQVAQHIGEATVQSDPTFVRGKLAIVTSPSRTFRSGDPVFVYFEIYNLSRDDFGSTRYEVSFSVGIKENLTQVRIRKQDGESVAVQYAQSGTETKVADYVELNIGKVKAGRYVMHMNVTDLNRGESSSRECVFRVVEK
jgi:GWxTD domain-containing protein